MFSRKGWVRIIVVLMAIVSIGAIAACAQMPAPAAPPAQAPAAAQPTTQAPPATTASAEPVPIKWLTWDVGMGSPEDIERDIIAPFEQAHPNINVEVELATWDLYWDKLQTQIAAGNPPDVFTQSIAFAYEYASKGFAEDLQPYFDRDLEAEDYLMDLTKGRVLRYPDADGNLYAMPFRAVDAALLYNKDLFDAAGLAYPNENWTFDDYLTAARALTKDTDGDGQTDQWGTIAFNDWIYPDTIIKAFGGHIVSEDFSKCMLTDPKSLEALQWIVDLIHKEKVAPPMDLASSPGWVQVGPFATGKVAMSLQGAWYFPDFRDKVDFDWDLTYVPSGPAGRFVYGGPDSLAIAKGSAHKDEAWEFIKYFTSDQVSYRAIGIGAIPFNKELAEREAWLEPGKKPENKEVIRDSTEYFFGDFGPGWLEWGATVKLNELAPAFVGDKSVADAAAAACAGMDPILAQWTK